jgi:hypothetical protein
MNATLLSLSQKKLFHGDQNKIRLRSKWKKYQNNLVRDFQEVAEAKLVQQEWAA